LVPVAHAAERPIMLGAYTPTEAQLAHEAGSDFVKLFPADGLGPAYIKNLRAPLPHLRIVPTGGVDLDTMSGFLEAGAVALGVGSSLVKKELIARADWPALTKLAAEFVLQRQKIN
jgi:2-dehydro-3-deoxyphosphogluconate aldolase/(4S)-4-hydroxy-2-oxoglutarate aldolase